jgi:hypothetical protein
MPDIPTVPGSEIDYNAPARAVKLNAGALEGAQRGRMAEAGALGGYAEQLGGLETDLIHARNARIAADVDLRMRSARQSYLESINNTDAGWKSPNDSTWKQGAKALSDQVREDIYGNHEKIPPMMKQQIDAAFNSWQGSLLIETQSMASAQMVNRAWGDTKRDYAEKLNDGDAVGALHSLNLARSTKIADPAEIDALERDIPKTIARNFIETGLSTNPQGTAELLASGASLPAMDQNGVRIVPSKVLTPKDLEDYQKKAHTLTDTWHKGNLDNLLKPTTEGGARDPVTGITDDEAIQEAMTNRQIEQRAGLGILASNERLRKAKTEEDAKKIKKDDDDARARVEANVRNPNAWGVNPGEYAKSLRADAANSITNPTTRQQTFDLIDNQLNNVLKTGETKERPVEKQMYDLINQDRDTVGAMVPVAPVDVAEVKAQGGHWQSVVEGKPATTRYVSIQGGLAAVKKDDFDMAQFPGMTKDQVVSAINDHAAKLGSQMAEWFKTKEGRDATFDEADAHRKTLERPWVMDAARNALSKKAPARPANEDEVKALPSGAPFILNGKLYTRS